MFCDQIIYEMPELVKFYQQSPTSNSIPSKTSMKREHNVRQLVFL